MSMQEVLTGGIGYDPLVVGEVPLEKVIWKSG